MEDQFNGELEQFLQNAADRADKSEKYDAEEQTKQEELLIVMESHGVQLSLDDLSLMVDPDAEFDEESFMWSYFASGLAGSKFTNDEGESSVAPEFAAEALVGLMGNENSSKEIVQTALSISREYLGNDDLLEVLEDVGGFGIADLVSDEAYEQRVLADRLEKERLQELYRKNKPIQEMARFVVEASCANMLAESHDDFEVLSRAIYSRARGLAAYWSQYEDNLEGFRELISKTIDGSLMPYNSLQGLMERHDIDREEVQTLIGGANGALLLGGYEPEFSLRGPGSSD